ncbi:MAG TPA: ABC transporter permease [Flavobacterium sp.]|uniref:ABC transporter permease n=1 Tax=Flavobacterium sp. TaxID=239 RepID=UPI002C2BBB09|nr:ABC transporter permease [Flavobacterium sp.]HNP33340.1 ABC transporter permease [Flavobacterium sp.]
MNNTSEFQQWESEIKSEHSLFSLNLKEVWQYRDLLFMLVKRDYITTYKQTILGPIWFFVQPILTTVIYVLLFGKIAKLSTDGTPQIAFYLSGIIIWNYFSEVLTKTSSVFRDSAHIMGKVYFPRLIMPLSIVVSGLFRFAIQFVLFIALVLYFTFIENRIHPNLWVLASPFLLLLMGFFSLGLGMIFSSLTTKYKDLVFLLTFGIQLFMYATPVVYTITSIPEKYRWIINSNPLTGIFECFRYGYLGSGHFEPSSLVYSSGFIAAILLLGIIIFNKVEKSFMDTV